MSLSDRISEEIKTAMRAKDAKALESLRAVKAALMLAQTETAGKQVDEAEEIKILQRLVKQRKDSAAIYEQQGRSDLAQPEIEQAEIIEKFLPVQLSESEIETEVSAIIASNGLSGMANMGKVMALASAQLAGRADGKSISQVVKRLLA